MHILLLSAYDAESHRYWRRGLVAAFPEHDWTVLSLPPRYFSWRIRGNSLSWAFNARETLEQPFDLIIATSMVDLTGLRGLVPKLASIPTLVYFHENQFAYPASGREFHSVEPQILNLYNALAADKVVFNSAFNRDTLIDGARKLLRKLPDAVPAGLPELIEQRSRVLPVPLPDEVFPLPGQPPMSPEPPWLAAEQHNGDDVPIKIAWAARWEFDKGPDRLLAIMRELERRAINYRMCITGQSFRNTPEAFTTIRHEFPHRLAQFGYVESGQEYRAWLASADAILSTAIHEFQGIAVLEAVAAGAIPVLPNRLAYPELVPATHLYDSHTDDLAREAQAAVDLLVRIRDDQLQTPDVTQFSWGALRERYRDLLEFPGQG